MIHNKLRVFVMNSPEEVNGVTWWRMYRPLAALAVDYDIEFVHNETGMVYPHHFLYADLALCYRPCEPNHVAAMQMAADHGVPVISDFDDDILHSNIGHPVWKHYRGKEAYVNACVALSSQIWVSTQALGKVFEHPNTIVIPNALYEHDLPAEPNRHDKTVLWRGSDLHIEDLLDYRQEYSRLLPRIKKFLWVGYMPTWGAQDKGADVQYETTWISTNRWFEYLRHQNLLAVTKPLAVCKFNDSKSNISWLEATAAGAVCIASSYAGKPGWEHALRDLPKNEEHYRHVWEQSREEIRTQYNFEFWNEVRYREIVRTVNGPAVPQTV